MHVRTTMITIETGAGAMPGQLACPEGDGPHPAVIVVQEAFGLNAHIKDVATRLAAEGYVTLAPDMFYRGGPGRTASYDDLAAAIGMMNALTDEAIVEDVGATLDTLAAHPAVAADRIGITGFCMGGRIAYLATCALPGRIGAAVSFYGGGIPVDRTATLAAPVLALFGGDDAFIPAADVQRLETAAARLGKAVEVVVYPGAPHGFVCNERESYRAGAAADAWERMLRFFAAHLGG